MGCVAPQRHFDLVRVSQLFRPTQFPVRRVETDQIAHRAQAIDAVLMNQGRRPRPDRIGDRIGTVVVVIPDGPSIGRVETEDPLLAGDSLPRRPQRLAVGALGPLAVGDIDAIARDGRAAVARTERRSPDNLRAARRKPLDQTLLAPHSIASGTEPLRPALGRARGTAAIKATSTIPKSPQTKRRSMTD